MISGASEEELIEAIGRADVLLEVMTKIKQLQKENKKQKEVIDKIEKYIEKQARTYGFSMPIELGTHFDTIMGILKEVSE